MKTSYLSRLLPAFIGGLTSFYVSNGLAANIAPSQQPPAGIAINNAPQFVAIAFDDNTLVDGQKWVLEQWGQRQNPSGTHNPATYDGTAIHTTFFNTCEAILINPEQENNAGHVKETWYQASLLGHEMANHTLNHLHGLEFSYQQWQEQIGECQKTMNQPFTQVDPEFPNDNEGIDAHAVGFRAPYLEYNDTMLQYLQAQGFKYDASIVEGYDPAHHGGNQYWPYTLNDGSPGADLSTSWGIKPPISQHAGLWEIPVYAFIVPDDETAKQYGIHHSIRDKIAAEMSWFDVQSGKIESGDYNLFYMAKLSGPEVLAIMKYNLDLRLAGNRAPLTFLGHSTQYDDNFDLWVPTESTAAERRKAIEDFLDYALSKPDVRIVSHIELVNWLENPTALPKTCTSHSWQGNQAYQAGQKVSFNGFEWQANWWSFNEEPSAGSWQAWTQLDACRSE
ncbi:polysaccharide deacetylase family protein [Vibrio gangliei]|uniref:polysaccharide deacetylase family protein n=1 Tax=Vibrio gangliei TaxID=2077090 RepID=UPI000D0140D1|nr:polysaccharide deacetylase family protein [Vibrio gangliei]